MKFYERMVSLLIDARDKHSSITARKVQKPDSDLQPVRTTNILTGRVGDRIRAFFSISCATVSL